MLCSAMISVNLRTGLLGEDDSSATDLVTLEKKLAEKRLSRQASQAVSDPTSPAQPTPSQDAVPALTPQSSLSPEPGHKDERRNSLVPEKSEKDEEAVAALSEMMCSLVTNNSGETRYIGLFRRCL